MRHSSYASLSLTLVAAAALYNAAGCSIDCADNLTCGEPPSPGGSGGSGGATGDPDACIPIVAAEKLGVAVEDTCGIFVRLAGDDLNPGTKAKPLATILRAIELAQEPAATRRIYVCGEEYPESLEIPSGITIYGGLNCAGFAWKHGGARTTIAPMPDAIPARFVKQDESKIHVEDFIFQAANSSIPGGSSIAVTADAVTLIELVRTDLIAGLGGDGESGSAPPGDVQPTDPNDVAIAGVEGSSACKGGGAGNTGPAGPANPLCPVSIGGTGGKGLEDHGENGGDGSPIPPDNPLNLGLGGMGSTGAGCLAGQIGAPGQEGDPGENASMATGPGTFTLAGYVGVDGTAGGDGQPGQGGGGGGAAKGKPGCYGASGGSGGAGGCGGKSGTGGAAGGSSVGLISLGATFLFEAVTIHVSSGGNGGDGGEGQFGGVGGEGGLGGLIGMGPAPGCAGGDGGYGGYGGKGGGGQGGHSIGIVWKTVAPPQLPAANVTLGAPGLGGAGAGVSKAVDGLVLDVLPLP